MKEFIMIGQIINTHGLKGEVKVLSLTDDVKRFKDLKQVYVGGEERKVSSCKFLNDKVVLKIEGIDTIEQAMKYKNKPLEVTRENAAKLEEGRYYIADLVGCKVIDTEGEELGNIDEVIQTPSNDVYWIKGKKELLIPAIKSIVINIDIEKEEVVIKPVKQWLSE